MSACINFLCIFSLASVGVICLFKVLLSDSIAKKISLLIVAMLMFSLALIVASPCGETLFEEKQIVFENELIPLNEATNLNITNACYIIDDGKSYHYYYKDGAGNIAKGCLSKINANMYSNLEGERKYIQGYYSIEEIRYITGEKDTRKSDLLIDLHISGDVIIGNELLSYLT